MAQNIGAKNAILGILNIVLIVIIVIGGYKLWQSYNQETVEEEPSEQNLPANLPEEELTETEEEVFCAQVITYALNPESEECEQFPTPCDVPEEWEECNPQDSETESTSEENAEPSSDETETEEASSEESENQTVYIHYFRGEQGNDCTATDKISIPLKEGYEFDEVAALITLLSPLPSEYKNDGYFSEIPPYTQLRDLRISGDGVATADFNENLNAGGGSCSMQARRAQIEKTLLQFPDIDEVVITVNGEAETALQP